MPNFTVEVTWPTTYDNNGDTESIWVTNEVYDCDNEHEAVTFLINEVQTVIVQDGPGIRFMNYGSAVYFDVYACDQPVVEDAPFAGVQAPEKPRPKLGLIKGGRTT